MSIDTTVRYRLQAPNRMNYNALTTIQVATGVDVFDPPNQAARTIALLWWASRLHDDLPTLSWRDLTADDGPSFGQLMDMADMSALDDDGIDDEPAAPAGPTQPGEDSTGSTSPG